MSRRIVTKLLGGEPKTGKEKGTSGGKLVTNLSTSKPKGDVGISASGSSDSVRSSSLQGSSKDVTSLDAISKSNNDGDLTVLLKTMKERTQKLQDSVTMWLMKLKTDIEIGSCTLSFQEDTPKELKTTRDLLQEITTCLKENQIRKIQENKLLIEQIENLDKEIAVLTSSRSGGWKEGDIHWQRIKHLRQKLQQVKVQPPTSVNGDRKKDDTLSSRLAYQEKKIQDIWAQFIQTQMTRSHDHLAMLNDIEKYFKENKRSIETFRFIEENANQEISLLKQDIENLQDEKRSPVIHETETDPALVKSLKQLRKELLLKKTKIAEARSTVSQKNASETQRMHEMESDELRSTVTNLVTDVCAFCATDGKLNPALYFCKDCSKFGRYSLVFMIMLLSMFFFYCI